jgi:hypothetical protein
VARTTARECFPIIGTGCRRRRGAWHRSYRKLRRHCISDSQSYRKPFLTNLDADHEGSNDRLRLLGAVRGFLAALDGEADGAYGLALAAFYSGIRVHLRLTLDEQLLAMFEQVFPEEPWAPYTPELPTRPPVNPPDGGAGYDIWWSEVDEYNRAVDAAPVKAKEAASQATAAYLSALQGWLDAEPRALDERNTSPDGDSASSKLWNEQ